MLGRQTLQMRPSARHFYDEAMTAAGKGELRIEALMTEDGYAERALEALGFGQVETLDFSDFEGATHAHDLNAPVGEDLEGKFDFILDGGTIEHVFDVRMALTNVFRMLRTGGIFVSANGMNGWWGHGLYQFSPDIVWSFWKRAAGCEVLRCEAVPHRHRYRAVALPDPAEGGRRLFGLGKRLPASRVYLYYEVRKGEGARLEGPALQSDYVARWSRHEERRETMEN